eukprot:gene4713-biopygen8478
MFWFGLVWLWFGLDFGLGWVGLVRSGLVRSGPVRSGPVRSGAVRSDPVRPGPVRSGPVRSGPIRSGAVRCGPIRSGPIRSGPIRPGPVRSGPVRSGTVWSGSARRRCSWKMRNGAEGARKNAKPRRRCTGKSRENSCVAQTSWKSTWWERKHGGGHACGVAASTVFAFFSLAAPAAPAILPLLVPIISMFWRLAPANIIEHITENVAGSGALRSTQRTVGTSGQLGGAAGSGRCSWHKGKTAICYHRYSSRCVRQTSHQRERRLRTRPGCVRFFRCYRAGCVRDAPARHFSHQRDRRRGEGEAQRARGAKQLRGRRRIADGLAVHRDECAPLEAAQLRGETEAGADRTRAGRGPHHRVTGQAVLRPRHARATQANICL